MGYVHYRWIDGPALTEAEWAKEMERIDAIFSARGWMSLNQATTKIRVAEDSDGKLLGFFCLQLMPHLEPLFVAPAARGTGIAESLIDDMLEFVAEKHIRGYTVTADNGATVAICRKHEMTQVESPVFVKV